MKPSNALVFLSALSACVVELPPPPALSVTSPERGLVESAAGEVVVTGTALPGPDGSAIAKLTVNGTPATVGADGSFTAVVAVPEGAMLLETVAISAEGGKAIDARAVHVGQLRPVGTRIDRAVFATLSAEAFARISEVASQTLNAVDLTGQIPPVRLGDSLVNLELTVDRLAIADATFALTPVDNGLMIDVEIAGLDLGAKAAYAGALVPDGSTSVKVTAEKIRIAGTLVVTPTETGFKTSIASPNVTMTALKLQASGLIGQVLDLLNNHLSSTVQKLASKGAEAALNPGINAAVGALAAPQRITVLGRSLEIGASPAEIRFSSAGALAGLDLHAKLAGGEASPGYIFTPNGTPAMDVGRGIEIGLADDLLNDMLAQVHAMKLLEVGIDEEFGFFDAASIKLQLPPMISANTADGKVRLVLGDMIATATDDGKPLVRAAINAQVDVAIGRGTTPSEIAIEFGEVHAVVNLLDDPENPSAFGPDELRGAADAGIGLQLSSLEQVLVSVPVPSIAGATLDNLSLRGDAGYIVAGGKIH